ncbi:pyridoxamine 5'-phosphate oxidase family protein [Luethyella okanaganae]|uniref:Pyridoxamine 5'-phosphate oxidase family protein n=1 Tax=Luethyella okanaganae TaxID=69372 RepID=A0ABW1VDN3_9MICO
MWQGEGEVAELSESQCWDLLRENELGRIATSVGGVVDIFPINYYADGSTILFRTTPGTKLVELTTNEEVAFEVDGHTDVEAWSVIAKGPAHAIERQSEIAAADAMPLHPWIPTLKYRFVRITPGSLSGRRFQRAPEPDRY